jgi:Family of unknown function (DUF5372)
VRIIHPFHPLSGQLLPCVGERYNRYGKRFLVRADDATVYSVPEQWTDMTPLDPEAVAGGNRALLRLSDFIELERLVSRLSAQGCPKRCKGNSAAIVNKLTPRNR